MPVRGTSGPWERFTTLLQRLGLVLSGPIAALVLALSVSDFGESWGALHNDGMAGTFTATSTDCSGRGGCDTSGTFVSDDGTVRREDVFIDSGGDEVGESVPAQWFNDKYGKVYEKNSYDIVWLTLIALVSTVWLVGWLWWFVVRPVRHRRRPAPDRPKHAGGWPGLPD